MAVYLGAISKNIDKVKVGEVILFAENDEQVMRKFEELYVDYVRKKVKKGTYDREQVLKLLEYFYQNYVRREMKKPSKYGYDPKLNPAERKRFAEYFRITIENDYL